MSDDDEDAINAALARTAAKAMYGLFVGLVEAGFSENQALKLCAMTLSTSGMADGMPALGGDEL